MLKISLENACGVLDVRVVETEDEAKAAIQDIVSRTAFFAAGDRIVVSEAE